MSVSGQRVDCANSDGFNFIEGDTIVPRSSPPVFREILCPDKFIPGVAHSFDIHTTLHLQTGTVFQGGIRNATHPSPLDWAGFETDGDTRRDFRDGGTRGGRGWIEGSRGNRGGIIP
jgi:hypothetical protein